MSNQPEHLDLAAVRKRLENTRGRTFWRSLEELAGSAGFEEMMHREFPRYASEWENVEERRSFLKLMGASLALAGLTACTRQPTEQIVPYVRQPEDVVPGKPLFYATAMPLSGIATGLLVESHEGRPTKVEGNPAHPGSLGASDVYSQASVLGLYDPDRSQALAYRGEIRSWSGFRGALHDAIEGQKGKQGAGLRILTETITSPTLADQLRGILKDFPQAKWHQWEPAGAHSERAGAQLAFGQPVNTYYNLQNADVVVSLDSDFLSSGPGSLRYARQFFSRRRIAGSQTEMNRLYVLEPFPSATGSKADHRFPVKAAEVEAFALALAKGLGAAVGGKVPQSEAFEKWGGPIIRDLQNHRGAGLVIAGEQQSPAVHALAHAMNQALGNAGKTVFYTDAVDANPVDQAASLRELVKDLDSGTVEVLLILGGNPVFTAPVELGLKDRIQKAKLRVRLGLYEDETSAVCHWHVPETHFLETWSDARAFDGTVSIMQPLISPLYRGKSAHEVLALLSDAPDRSGYEIVKGYWQTQHPGADFEAWWRRAVHDGVIADSALPTKTPALRAGWADGLTPARNAGGLEVVFRPDAGIYDGRFANNGWLQEFPRPVHKLSWDNAAFLSPATAARLSFKTGDL
ncbi:MAG TPA: TAT-variant-translocated molybdopterin oxidoreductase, partial [Bryobacteraceae bacterium]|nr:TAT-variant-translocated molybdopterin oxidoreductase [Bryobacteraceae bacterium]